MPYSAQREQLARRQKLLDMLAQQSVTQNPTQMVSGRAVPQGFMQQLGPVLQAMMAKKGGEDITARRGELDTQESSGIRDAMTDTMAQYKGREAEVLPQGQYGPAAPAVAPDPTGAAMNVATDPFLSKSKPAQAMMMQLMKNKAAKSGGKNYSRALPTTKGWMSHNVREDSISPLTDAEGNILQPPKYDVERQSALTGGKKGAEYNVQMSNPNSPEYRKAQKDHAMDLKTEKIAEIKTSQALQKINTILDKKNTGAFNKNFGGYNALISQYSPGDETQNMRAEIESVKSDLKMAGLEMIRSGGSIGQMTEREWPIVQNMIQTITPVMGEDKAREAFKNIKTYLERINKNAKDIYQDRWGKTPFAKATDGVETIPKTPETPKTILRFDAQGNQIP